MNTSKAVALRVETGKVYCPMCTHTVEALIEHHAKHSISKPGQKCPRCSGSLDAGYIFRLRQAA
jgi:transposase-like protein